MLERFTEQSQAVVLDADRSARVRGESRLLPEHLLLGFLSRTELPTAALLEHVGVSRHLVELCLAGNDVRDPVEVPSRLDVAARTEAIFAASRTGAHALGSQTVTPVHLLLAMLSDGERPNSLWSRMALDPRGMRSELMRLLPGS